MFAQTPDGKNKLHLGLYIDSFVYFSESRETEKVLKEKLKELVNVNFMWQVTHFLGIKFQWQQEEDNTECWMSHQEEVYIDQLIIEGGGQKQQTWYQ